MRGDMTSMARTAASFVDQLAPRTRVLTTLVCIIGILALNKPAILLVAVGAAATLVWLAGISGRHVRQRLTHLEGFMVLLLALLPFTTPGTTLFTLGPIQASHAGVLLAVTILLTVNACVLVLLALLSTMTAERLAYTLARMGMPLKLAHLFVFTTRFIGLFRTEATRLQNAMRARGFVARSNLHTWRSLGNLVGMLLVRSLERADRVDEAMRCRCFAGRVPISAAPSPNRIDGLFFVLVSTVLFFLLGANWWL